MRFLLFIVILAVSYAAYPGQPGCEDITGRQLHEKLYHKPANTMESWWVVSTNDKQYQLEQRIGLSSHCYKVNKTDVTIDIDSRKTFPINLKIWNVHFPDQ